jgi:6-pyruvoyltetrahydropterin/6-carboxytetrahydropterin synthase
MIYVTRRYRFAASHRLHAPSLSQSENRELYGKCNNPYGHGHNYLLEVSALGPVEERTGSAVNVTALDGLVTNHVLGAFDQHNLNTEVAAFAGLVPTAENIALEAERILREHWRTAFPGQWPRLAKVRIYETRRNSVELAAGSQAE